MISRVTRTKGVLDFAAAAQKLRALRPEIEFVLAGAADGEGFDALNDESSASSTDPALDRFP